MKLALVSFIASIASTAASSLRAADPTPTETAGFATLGACVIAHCLEESSKCALETECRATLECTMACKLNDPSCFFMCEMDKGYGNAPFTATLQCMAENKCLPPFAEDGKCRVTDSDGLHTLTSVDAILGDWWVIRGLNPHYDSYHCQHNRYLKLADGSYINDVTWNNTFVVPNTIVEAKPVVTFSKPGVVLHDYQDIGLKPQLEKWVVLQKFDNYMLMLWCGSNAALTYAGGIIVSPNRTLHGMPLEIEQSFRDILAKYGVDYDYDMQAPHHTTPNATNIFATITTFRFPNDNTNCPV